MQTVRADCGFSNVGSGLQHSEIRVTAASPVPNMFTNYVFL